MHATIMLIWNINATILILERHKGHAYLQCVDWNHCSRYKATSRRLQACQHQLKNTMRSLIIKWERHSILAALN